MSAGEIHDCIRNRRTVKPALFDDRVVPDAKIQRMLEAANWAPTHGMTEPWRFRVYSGAGRTVLADQLETLYLAATPENERIPAKQEKARQNPLRSSHAIVLTMMVGTNPKIPDEEELAATACAVQNMQLSAHAQGLGSFWSTGPMTWHPAAPEIFALDDSERYLGVLYVGRTTKTIPDSRRGAVEEKTIWIRQTATSPS